MARDGAGVARQCRDAAQRKARRRWAKESADRAILKLSQELSRARSRAQNMEDVLGQLLGDAEIADRICCVVPVLKALLAGRPPAGLEVMRRNVALHADAAGVSIASATVNDLKKLQKAPRIEVRQIGSALVSAAPASFSASAGDGSQEVESKRGAESPGEGGMAVQCYHEKPTLEAKVESAGGVEVSWHVSAYENALEEKADKQELGGPKEALPMAHEEEAQFSGTAARAIVEFRSTASESDMDRGEIFERVLCGSRARSGSLPERVRSVHVRGCDCGNGLERAIAECEYVCDQCGVDISTGAWLSVCERCDFSECARCSCLPNVNPSVLVFALL